MVKRPGTYKVLYEFTPVCPNNPTNMLPQSEAFHPSQAMYLLEDGQVYSKHYNMKISPPEYCMDDIVVGENETQPMTVMCFPGLEEKEAKFYTAYSACMIVSSIFLLLTLILSLILPDASRLSTWTMCCYTGSLLVASIFLVVLQMAQAAIKGDYCVFVGECH